MTDQLETALTRTLSEAAETALAQPPGLVDEVEGRFRSRRRRRYAAVAGVAAFAVIGGSALAAGVITGKGAPPGPSVVRVPAAAPGDEPPIADVWPEAYHKLLAKLADGRKYHVEGMIDDHRLLIATEASFENADELWALDLKTSKAHRLVRLPAPHKGHQGYASQFTTGSGQIVWWDWYAEDGKAYTRIWKAPVTGGEPTLVSTVSGPYGTSSATGDRLVVVGDTVYFSSWAKGGVRKVPLAGGEATTVPDTDGYHIVHWPWLGKPGQPRGSDAACDNVTEPDPSCGVVTNETRFRIFTDLRNVETGDERDADVDGMKNASCGLTYCLSSVDGRSVARTRDGSRTVPLPGDGGLSMMSPPAWDRFVVVMHRARGQSPVLFDIKSGTSGSFGIKPSEGGSMTVPSSGPSDQRWLVWSTDEGRTYHLLDLAAIR